MHNAPAGNAKRNALHMVLILLLGFLAYSNTFGVPFVFDDIPNITLNPLIKDVSNVPAFFAGREGPFASRPLMHATFALNYYLGGLDTRGYHAVNLALHLLNALLLYLLVVTTGKHMGHDESGVRTAGFVSSLLFAVHPLQTEAVTYIVSRSMLLATTFYFLGPVLFLKAVTAKRKRGLYVVALFIASLLGMASRENFATFPLMLVLYDLFFVSGFDLKKASGNWKAHLPVFLSLAYLAHLVLSNTYDRSLEYPGEGIPPLDYALTQLNVHWTYLRLLILPLNQNIDHDYPIAGTLFEMPTALSFLGYVGLLAGSALFARRRPVVSYSVLWFLITLIPISFGVALLDLRLGDVMLEHRLYLPGAGFFLAAGAGAALVSRKSRLRGRRLVTASAVALSVFLAILAHSRNAVWQSDLSLWTDAVKKAPVKARNYNNLAMAYQSRGMSQEAVRNFKTAIGLRPDFPLAHYNLGSVYGSLGLLDEAEKHLLEAVELQPNYGHAHNNLGNVYFLKGDLDRAVRHFELAVKYRPDNYEAHRNLAMVYGRMGLKRKAQEHLRISEGLMPEQR